MVEAQGWVHFQAGRAEDAERELRQALDLDPQNVSAFHHLGRLLEAARQLDSAESYYIRGAMVASPMANPNRAALRALYVARRGSAEGYDPYYAGIRDLDRARRRSTMATEIKAARDRDTLPSFRLTALSGDTLRSSTLAGRVTVINFWGTWCGPCVAEMPEMQRFWQSVAPDTTVRFLTISNDQSLRDLREWLGKRRYDIPVLIDGGYAARVGVNAFPTTWFLDRAGRIAFVKRGWSEALAEEFGWRVEMLKAETTTP
jgi:thiol-disulfide isomerase/thioredoxin